MEKDVARHLAHNYGTRALQVAQMAQRDPKLSKRLCPKYPILAAEVIFAVEQVCNHLPRGVYVVVISDVFWLQEYAQTVVDCLARRTRLAFMDAGAATDVLPAVIELMAGPLEWSKARKEQELRRGKEFLASMIAK
jgi:glycerol-3-phosphate dehydrogenase